MRMRLLAAVTGVTVLAVLSGCTGGAGQSPSGPVPTGVGSPTAAAPATSVPPPSPGNTSSTAPNPRESTKPPVKMDEPAKTGKVVATVVKLKAIKAKARMPGEVAGPGLAITVKLVNNSKKAFDSSGVLVTLYDSRNAPGGEMSAPPSNPMTGVLKPGESAQGVYVFTIPVKRRSPVTINLTLPTESPVLAFRGKAPTR